MSTMGSETRPHRATLIGYGYSGGNCNMLLCYIAMVCRTKYSFYFIKQNTCILPDCDSPCLGIIVFVMEEKQIRILFTLFDVSPLGRAGVSGPAPGHLHTGIVTTSEHRGITAEYNPILLFTATLWKWETENVNVISAGSEGLTEEKL